LTCEMLIITKAAAAEVVQNRFIPPPPSAAAGLPQTGNIVPARSHFKAARA